jgi:hypothetical protein
MPKKTDNTFSWKDVEAALGECRRMARSLPDTNKNNTLGNPRRYWMKRFAVCIQKVNGKRLRGKTAAIS